MNESSRRPTKMSDRVAAMATTRTGLRIGLQTVPPQAPDWAPDAIRLQAALLNKRTAPATLVGRIAGAIWRFL